MALKPLKLQLKQSKDFKYFRFSDFFDYERGKRLTKENQIAGDIAYISSTAINNGIDNYITPPSYMKVYHNKLTLSNSGSVAYLFYHDYEFVASDHVMVIWAKDFELSKYIALFLKPIFERIRYRYNLYAYGRKFNQTRIKETKLLLPAKINDQQQYIPDWLYMENYIKSLPYADLI